MFEILAQNRAIFSQQVMWFPPELRKVKPTTISLPSISDETKLAIGWNLSLSGSTPKTSGLLSKWCQFFFENLVYSVNKILFP